MAVFKFVISDKKKSYQVEKDQKDAPVIGRQMGDTIDGSFLGMDGYELTITGGSDKDGFPMRKDIEGQLRKRFLITKGVGFHTKVGGLRKRKMLRGNTIADDIRADKLQSNQAGKQATRRDVRFQERGREDGRKG